jgi:hypothetical protein
MNSYKISFSMFQIIDGKISSKNHFSNCKATIKGNTFEDAVETFKEEKLNEGWVIGFLTEGDMFHIELFDLN